MDLPDLDETSCPTGEQYRHSTSDRTRFNSDFSKVLGYPSSGGVLMLPLDIAVADYLGLPRLESAYRASDPVEEDTFCDSLRLLGAKWWESEDGYIREVLGIEDMTELEVKKMEKEMVVGWPAKDEEGVWIFRARRSKDYPKDFAMLGMCVSMKERCALLKRWGATFHADPREVGEFEGVLEKKFPR